MQLLSLQFYKFCSTFCTVHITYKRIKFNIIPTFISQALIRIYDCLLIRESETFNLIFPNINLKVYSPKGFFQFFYY